MFFKGKSKSPDVLNADDNIQREAVKTTRTILTPAFLKLLMSLTLISRYAVVQSLHKRQ